MHTSTPMARCVPSTQLVHWPSELRCVCSGHSTQRSTLELAWTVDDAPAVEDVAEVAVEDVVEVAVEPAAGVGF